MFGSQNNKWSKNFDERPHRRSGFFTGKVDVTPASREQCSGLRQSRWWHWAYRFLCCVHCSLHKSIHQSSHSPDNPQNCPFPWGTLDGPIEYTHMVPWVHPSHPPKQHLDRFSRFCTAHERDQQTDTNTQTTLLRL